MKPLLPCQIDAWNRAEALVAGFATVVLQMDCGALVVIDAAGFGWVMTLVSARPGDPDQRAILSPLEGPLSASVLAVRYACPALISYSTAAARARYFPRSSGACAPSGGPSGPAGIRPCGPAGREGALPSKAAEPRGEAPQGQRPPAPMRGTDSPDGLEDKKP